MNPLTVTFDTNTLASVVSPESAQRESGISGAVVQAALRAGRIQGFFSETLLTLEGIENKNRWEVLGRTRVVSETSSTGENTIRLSVGIRQDRDPLNCRFSARVQAAIDLGMRPLRAAARIGTFHHKSYPLFEPPGGNVELFRCMDKVNEMTTEIAKRGVGQTVAVELGLHFSTREGVVEPELWLQGLGRARDEERKVVAVAVREWADGDSVATHYGFGMQLFCSEDFGKSHSGRSVLDCDNRKWLNGQFGIEFVTLAELAQKVVE